VHGERVEAALVILREAAECLHVARLCTPDQLIFVGQTRKFPSRWVVSIDSAPADLVGEGSGKIFGRRVGRRKKPWSE
jgi:hypothetical protein